MNQNQISVGSDVICNGYRGTVTEVCTGKLQGMVIVRVPGGTVCVGSSSLRAVTALSRFDRFDKFIT